MSTRPGSTRSGWRPMSSPPWRPTPRPSTGSSAARSRPSCSAGATWRRSASIPPCAASSRPATTIRWRPTRCRPRHPRVECPEAELCELGPVVMASLGVVPTTPWNTERETSEEDLGKQISAMLDQVPEGKEAILNIHCPPYASGLDDAPELDETLKPVIRGGRPSIVPVGSHAVREAIPRYQPVIGLHGHIHE